MNVLPSLPHLYIKFHGQIHLNLEVTKMVTPGTLSDPDRISLPGGKPKHRIYIGAISIARDPVKHELTKHIGVDAYFTRAQVQDDEIALRYVPSELQLADFFTKARTREQHSFYLSKLNVIDPP